MQRIFTFLLLSALFLGACKETKPSFEGTISGANDMQVLLEQLHFDNTRQTINRIKTDPEGHFTMERKEPLAQGLYLLTVGAKRVFFALEGTEKQVKFSGDLGSIDKYVLNIEGSKAMKCHADILSQAIGKGAPLTQDEVKKAIGDACNPLIGAMVAQQLAGQNIQSFLPQFKETSKALNAYMPGSKYALDFETWIASVEKSLARQQSSSTIQIGQPAPEIALPGPDGKTRKLSDMKGKIVLLDFWASWCRPCRMANPHVVEVYNKYKNKGFDVFSVSLDRQNGKQAWINAIQKDGLIWDNHVSDLKYWNSVPAAVYGVQGIPKTFLIDRDGKIAAINPRNNLEEVVKAAL